MGTLVTNPIGCDIHEMYTDYTLLLSRMDWIGCRTGQGVDRPDAAYARHKKAIIGKRPLLAWHVQFPWQSALAQVDAFLKIQPPEDGVRHSWDAELVYGSKAQITDHLLSCIELTKVKTGQYPAIYTGPKMYSYIEWNELPKDIPIWWALYIEFLKPYAEIRHDSQGYTLVDEQLIYDLRLPTGISKEQVIIHQPTSNANGRLYGAWTAADGRLDIDFWLQGGQAGMLNWFGLGDDMKIKVKPEAAAWTVQVDSPGERMTSTAPLDVIATDSSWYQLATGKWVPGWHFDIVEEPEPEPPEPLWRGRVIPEIGLNVRSGKNFLNNVIRVQPHDSEVGVYEESGTWARIHQSSAEWVAARFLEKIKDGEPVPSDPDTGDGVMGIEPLCQRDYPQKLGTSNTTIAGYGCLLTAVTMYANWLLVEDYNPVQMNEIIKKVNGFVNGNLFRFAALWEAFPQIGADKLIRTPLTPAPLDVIDAILEDNRPVIVETRLNKVQQHWVLIVGKRDGKYVINDPWTGKQVFFEDVYGDAARWIYSIVSYRRK